MSSMFKLTRILFKNGGGLLQVEGKNKKIKALLLSILILASFLPLSVSLFFGVRTVFPALKAIGAEISILSIALSAISFTVFVFGIFMVLNIFYFSTEIEFLLPLPLKPSNILSAKLFIAMFYEYLIIIIFYLPVVLSYGIEDKAGILFIIYSLVIFLVLPIIPLVMASIINIIIMRFTNLGKHKEFTKVLGGIFGIFLILGINFYTQNKAVSMENPQDMVALLTNKNSIINLTAKIFPLSKFGSLALLNSANFKGILNLLIFLGISILIFAVFVILGNELYIKGVIGITEAPSKRIKMTKEKMRREVVSGSPFISYFWKEIRLLFRTSIYFLNCILMNFLWPVFILIPLLTDKNAMNSFTALRTSVNSNEAITYILLGVFGFMIFISSSNVISSTAISREGKYFYVNKYIPLSYKTQIMAKVFSGVFISYIGVLLVFIVGEIVLRLSIVTLLIMLIISPVAVLYPNLLGIIIDLINPKLKWDSEQKAVKQNVNGMIAMFGGAAIIGGMVFLLFKLSLEIKTILMVTIAVTVVFDLIMYLIIVKKGAHLCEKIN
ncbi:MAG: hypothetical protein LIR50_06670 [Bacillota bacterium]|nr:hypothetical protein [Bacillota bacterium]